MLKRNKHKESGELLLDYYDGQAGLPMEPGYDEITLTATEDPKKLRMDVYSRPTGNGEVESSVTYLVSSQVLDDAMKLVKKYKMARWNKRGYIGIGGRKIVCKFYWKDEFIRVSSEKMPENGKGAFADIRSALFAYIDPASKIENLSDTTNNDMNIKKEMP